MKFDALDLFHSICPDYFEREYIRSLPPEDVYEELILDLRDLPGDSPELPCPPEITFGIFRGDRARLYEAIAAVDEDWVQWYPEDGEPAFCAFHGDRVVSFCLLDDFGTYRGLRVGAPGCVGTVPQYRKRGIGLKMVQLATRELKTMGYDLSYIHYTAVGPWYARLGYETVVKWTSGGIFNG